MKEDCPEEPRGTGTPPSPLRIGLGSRKAEVVGTFESPAGVKRPASPFQSLVLEMVTPSGRCPDRTDTTAVATEHRREVLTAGTPNVPPHPFA